MGTFRTVRFKPLELHEEPFVQAHVKLQQKIVAQMKFCPAAVSATKLPDSNPCWWKPGGHSETPTTVLKATIAHVARNRCCR